MFRVLTISLSLLVSLTLAACGAVSGGSIINRDTDNQSVSEPGKRSPLEPIPGEENMSRGAVMISRSDLLIMESYPFQIALEIEGELPSPCHYLRADVSDPDAQNRIQVELYSLSEPEIVCIQVLEPFTTNISLGSFQDGSYTVWLNGEQVGEFNQ